MSTSHPAARSPRKVLAVLLLSALLIAGVASYYASSHPDGLNFVAKQNGFVDQQKTSPASHGPFARYSTKGIHNQRLSKGVAGVAGCLLVLSIAGGMFWVLRRRDDDIVESEHDASSTPGA